MTIGGVDAVAVVVDREWRPPFPLDLHGVLAPLRRGRGDPTWRTAVDGAVIWRVSTTPAGPATVAIRRRADGSPHGTVRATGWGPGAAWEIDRLPSLLGAGVDHARRTAILHAAVVAHRLERAVELGGEQGRVLLRRVRGIGVWTAAETAQRAWGDPDAVSFGDFHVPNTVGWALLGHDLDDAGMLEVLAPYVPQRQRAVRYIEASGFRRPRFGPRFSPRDYRSF